MDTNTAARPIDADQIARFRADGFTHCPQIISPDEAARFRDRFLAEADRHRQKEGRLVFDQYVNLWRHDPALLALAMHPTITATAAALAGCDLRLWHDHLLIKRAHSNTPTEFHQDQPYWPFQDTPPALSCWLALEDVPFERGCMSFIPGSHRLVDLQPHSLHDDRSLFGLAPELEWEPRASIPLRAGGCTWHYGYCAHRAEGNSTDQDRIAVAIIYMPIGTRYREKHHLVTDPLALQAGDELTGDLFPVAIEVH